MRGVLRGRRANLNTRGKGAGRTSTPLTPTATCVHLYRHLPQGVLEPLSFLIPSLCARHLLQCLLVPASPTSAESMDGFRSPYLEWVRNALARRLARPTAGRVDADPTQDLGRLLLFLLIFDFFPFLARLLGRILGETGSDLYDGADRHASVPCVRTVAAPPPAPLPAPPPAVPTAEAPAAPTTTSSSSSSSSNSSCSSSTTTTTIKARLTLV